MTGGQAMPKNRKPHEERAGVRAVTEAEWLGCNDPEKMLELLRGKASDRKLRLFACACCRRLWHLMAEESWRQAVEMAERYEIGRAHV